MNVKHILANKTFLKAFVPKRTLKGVHKYWNSRDLTQKNSCVEYTTDIISSQNLVKISNKYINQQANILELGCNVGRNLNEFHKSKYFNLSGIEINSFAIESMKIYYPMLDAKIYKVPIENIIRDFSNDQFDLVFTFAVLMHIHPKSEWIFSEMVRITKDVLIIVEDETGQATKNFPRNYKKIFEDLGMKEIESSNSIIEDRPNYKIRVFRRKVEK